jgi:serine/threonine-protein kinase
MKTLRCASHRFSTSIALAIALVPFIAVLPGFAIDLPPRSQISQRAQAPTLLDRQDAVSLVEAWLEAKANIFSPPYDRDRAAEITTGALYYDIVKPGGSIDWLSQNNAYYRYGVQRVDTVHRFAAEDRKATIDLVITESSTLYENGEATESDFDTQSYRYELEFTDGRWKVADYRQID